MNKAQLVDVVAKRTRFSKVDSEMVLDAAIAAIQAAVAKGEEVKIVGFGTFSRVSRKARTARNPKTGKSVEIPAGKMPKFKPGKDFRQSVQK